MKRLILLIFMAMASSGFAQLVSTSHSIQNDIPAVGAKPVVKAEVPPNPQNVMVIPVCFHPMEVRRTIVSR